MAIASSPLDVAELEHHANIVPWQQLCEETSARLRVAPVDQSGQVILDEYEKLLGPSTRLVAFSHVSNVLGTVTPACERVQIAHRHGALVLIDGAQAGTAPEKAAVLSFVLDGVAAEDIGEALDREGIAVRTGHHCAQPIVRRYGHERTVRASLALYNTRADIDALTTAVRHIATRTSQLPRGTGQGFNAAMP